MDCPHCKGSGQLPEREWRVRRTVIQEVIVKGGNRADATEKAIFAGASKSVEVTAAPLKPVELKPPYGIAVNPDDELQHIHDGNATLCGAACKWTRHRNDLDASSFCVFNNATTTEKGAFDKRRVI